MISQITLAILFNNWQHTSHFQSLGIKAVLSKKLHTIPSTLVSLKKKKNIFEFFQNSWTLVLATCSSSFQSTWPITSPGKTSTSSSDASPTKTGFGAGTSSSSSTVNAETNKSLFKMCAIDLSSLNTPDHLLALGTLWQVFSSQYIWNKIYY